MCLGIPGKVIRTFVEHDVLMGKVDFGGVSKQVCLEHVRDVQVGQYVLVHVGFALSKIDPEEAAKVFAFLEGMNQLDELQERDPTGTAAAPEIVRSASPSPGTPGEGRGEGDFDRTTIHDAPIHPNPLPKREGTESAHRAATLLDVPQGTPQ